jgi:hypothetical protein
LKIENDCPFFDAPGLFFAAMDMTALPHSFSPFYRNRFRVCRRLAGQQAQRKNPVEREDAILPLSLRPVFVGYNVLYHSQPLLAS